MKKSFEIKIPCDCHTEEIRIEQFDKCDDLYYMSFWACTFYSGQIGLGSIWARIKMAWLALRRGNYIHQEIVLTRGSLLELATKILHEVNPESYTF